MALTLRPPASAGLRVPGLARQLALRQWTISETSVRSGVSRSIIAKAVAGGPVSSRVVRAIVAALEQAPVSPSAVALFEDID